MNQLLRSVSAMLLLPLGILMLAGGWFSWTGTHVRQYYWLAVFISCLGVTLDGIAVVVASPPWLRKGISIIAGFILIGGSLGLLRVCEVLLVQWYGHVAPGEADYLSRSALVYPALLGLTSLTNLILLYRSGYLKRL